MAPVVDAAWLREHRAGLVVADVRWYLDGRSGRAAYDAGHLPGAVFVDLDRWLSAGAGPAAGRHPLPGRARARVQVAIVAGSVQLSVHGKVIRVTRSVTTGPTSSARSPPPAAARAVEHSRRSVAHLPDTIRRPGTGD